MSAEILTACAPFCSGEFVDNFPARIGDGNVNGNKWDIDLQRVIRLLRRHQGARDAELQDHQPARGPRADFAQRRVGVRVSGAGDRHGRCELRIAKRREAAREAGDQEGKQHCGPGEVGGGVTGQHEDAGADDATDTEEHEVPCAEAAAEILHGCVALDVAEGLAQQASAGRVVHAAGA